MSINELHDLLSKLKSQADDLSLDAVERRQHLTEIIESLEEQILSDKGIKANNTIIDQLEDKVLHFEVEHPAIASVLGSILNTLKGMGI